MAKCAECGFLAARNSHNRQLEEVENVFREEGKPSLIYDKDALLGMGGRHESEPLCFAQVYDLRSEFMASTLENHPSYSIPDNESIRSVIHETRKCNNFVRWQQGFTPKEHREMIDRKEMLKWQADREDADRKWREKQDKKLVIIAGGFTILGALIGTLIALFH